MQHDRTGSTPHRQVPPEAAQRALDELDHRNRGDRFPIEQVSDALAAAFPIMLRDFLWSDEARDVTGSWGHDNVSGDEFREQLMAALCGTPAERGSA